MCRVYQHADPWHVRDLYHQVVVAALNALGLGKRLVEREARAAMANSYKISMKCETFFTHADDNIPRHQQVIAFVRDDGNAQFESTTTSRGDNDVLVWK